jgi:hypothetical protein
MPQGKQRMETSASGELIFSKSGLAKGGAFGKLHALLIYLWL